MKFVLLHLATTKEDWSEAASHSYARKIEHFVQFEIVALKPRKTERGNEKIKREEEGKQILSYLKDGDELVLFDERGKNFSSEKFSEQIRLLQESGKKRVVFVIGGPYGISESVQERARLRISLAPFVMNHLVAQLVALEQIYRSFTLIKGLPYHNP